MGDWKALITTNREVVNAMTDEQLAIWALRDAPAIGRRHNSSLAGLVQWLGEPAAKLIYRKVGDEE